MYASATPRIAAINLHVHVIMLCFMVQNPKVAKAKEQASHKGKELARRRKQAEILEKKRDDTQGKLDAVVASLDELQEALQQAGDSAGAGTLHGTLPRASCAHRWFG